MSYKKDPKFLNQIQYCEHNGIPLIVIIGAEEKEKGKVKIRVVAKRDPPDEVLKLNRIILLIIIIIITTEFSWAERPGWWSKEKTSIM